MKRSSFESSGYRVIDDYLSREECDEHLELIASYTEQYGVPEIYRPMKHRSLRYKVIDGEQIREHLSKIWKLYQSVINELVSQVTNSHFVALANARVGVNVNIMSPGLSEYRWHYDRNAITAILYLNEVEGGETELYPNYRILVKNKNHMRIQQMLDRSLQVGLIRDVFGGKTVIKPSPGRLTIMRGDRCWHSVRSVQGTRERISVILAYDVPDAQFPMETSLDSYLYTQENQTSSDPNYG